MNSDSHNAARGPARIVGTDAASLDEAARILLAGGLVAVPTETVYGLGADAQNPAAVRRVFELKGRPATHPLIVHIDHPRQLERWALSVPPAAQALAERFWPGPLTLVLRRAPAVDLAGAAATHIADHQLHRSADAGIGAVALAQREDVDVFVEVMGGHEGPAKLATEAAIAAGKDVVSANKALLAHHGQALALAARRN